MIGRRELISGGLFALLTISLSLSTASSAKAADVQDEPGLPRVLLIGDSISMGLGTDHDQGYEEPTRTLLRGKANVHGISGNGGNTDFALQHLSEWLGQGQWDVIHFNWGLHDLARKSN